MIKKKTFTIANEASVAAIDPKSLQCRVNLLDGEEIVQDFNKKVPGQIVLDWVCSSLGILERDYFGLLFWSDKAQMQWLDLMKPLKKQISKTSCRFNFLVKFYAVDPASLQGITRHLFFLQIKRDISAGTLSLPIEATSHALALVLQAELGDLNPLLQREKYVSHFHLIPNQSPELEKKVEEDHGKLRGMSRRDATIKLLLRVKWLDGYGMRTYSAKGSKNSLIQLGLAPPGISLFQRGIKTVTYLWSQITQISYKGKKISITVLKEENNTNTLSYEMDSYSATKNLWKVTIEMLNFYRNLSENQFYGREIDSLVDPLDVQSSPYPSLNRRSFGVEFPANRNAPKRSSVPNFKRHTVKPSCGSSDSSPRAPRPEDLVDSLDVNERGIDVGFPPTPPSSRETHEAISGSNSLPVNEALPTRTSPDSGSSQSEHYKRLSYVQQPLGIPSGLPSGIKNASKRKFRSHLLQSEQPDQDTAQTFVLPIGSPTDGRLDDSSSPTARPAFDHSNKSPTYVNLEYFVNEAGQTQLAVVREQTTDSSSDEDGATALTGRVRNFATQPRYERPASAQSTSTTSMGRMFMDERASVRVRRTRHDTPPSSSSSSAVSSPLRSRERDSLRERRTSQRSGNKYSYYPGKFGKAGHTRQMSADADVTSGILDKRKAKPEKRRSSSVTVEYDIEKEGRNEAEVLNGQKESPILLLGSSNSCFQSQDSLIKFSETLGDLSPSSFSGSQPMSRPATSQGNYPRTSSLHRLPKKSSNPNLASLREDASFPSAGSNNRKSMSEKHQLQVKTHSFNILRHHSFNEGKNKGKMSPLENLKRNKASKLTQDRPRRHYSDVMPSVIIECLREESSQPLTPPEDGLSDYVDDDTLKGKRKSLIPQRVASICTLNRVFTPPPEFMADDNRPTHNDQQPPNARQDGHGNVVGGLELTVEWPSKVFQTTGTPHQSESGAESFVSNSLERRKEADNLTLPPPPEAFDDSNVEVMIMEPGDRVPRPLSSLNLPISVSQISEIRHSEGIQLRENKGRNSAFVSDGRKSPDISQEQLSLSQLAQFASEGQLSGSSASSSPGSKISEFILKSESPTLKLISDDMSLEPLSNLAELVTTKMLDSTGTSEPARKEGHAKVNHTSKMQSFNQTQNNESPKRDHAKEKKHVRRSLLMEHDNQPALSNSKAGKASKGYKTNKTPPKEGSVVHSGKMPPDLKYQVIGNRGHKKKQSKLPEPNNSRGRQPIPASRQASKHNMLQQQANMAAYSQSYSGMEKQNPPVHVASKNYYFDDSINPYAISRPYFPEEFNQMSQPSFSDVGFQKPLPYRHQPSMQYQWEPAQSQEIPMTQGFNAQTRNAYQYRSYSAHHTQPVRQFTSSYPIQSTSSPPPMYLNPPSYSQRPTSQTPSGNSSGRNSREDILDDEADNSREDLNPTVKFSNRPPSRADAVRPVLSPDRGYYMLETMEPIALSQPVSMETPMSSYHTSAFNSNFRRSMGPAVTHRMRPVTNYGYSVLTRGQPIPSKSQYQSGLHVGHQKSFTPYCSSEGPTHIQQNRPSSRQRAQTPIILSTPNGGKSRQRRLHEAVQEEEDGQVAYYIL